MLLCAFAGGEDPRRHRMRTYEFAHRTVDPIDIKEMILLTFSEQHVLLYLVRCRQGCAVRWRPGSPTGSWFP